MRARWNQWVDVLQTSFWFVPIVMLLLSGCLAIFLLYVDRRFDPGVKSILQWAYSGGPEGARSLLSTIAGSMITAASVTFSLASVALSIASQQYGSRVLRNFMRDKITQILLGTFVSTFLYSVLVVRAIRGTDVSGGFVPAIAVTTAILLAVISLMLLVFFIHHVSSSIQASRIVNVIAEDLRKAIPRLYPSQSGETSEPAPQTATLRNSLITLNMERSGYLESLDLERLLELATKHDLVLEILPMPGDHLVHGDAAVRISSPAGLDDSAQCDIRTCFLLGGERTPLQDIRYQFQQLTDVVIRALSPGINDPFTAINGIDQLATGIALFARRPRVVDRLQDKQGQLRLILATTDLARILEETLAHIAIYAAGDRFVMAGLRRILDIAERYHQGSAEAAAVLRLRHELDLLQRARSSSS